MCAIVDANAASRFFTDPVDPELRPLWEWIASGRGVLVVGGQLRDELFEISDARRLLRNWERSRRAHFVPSEEVEDETARIEDHCRSNDAPVIALARVSKARLLCSKDRRLHADFRDRALIDDPRGHIYQNRTHRNLLTHEGNCPLDPPAAERRQRRRSR